MVTLGLTNILNENHTELNFFEVPFTKSGERNKFVRSGESRSEARSKRKRNILLTSALLVPYKRRQNDELARTEIVNY